MSLYHAHFILTYKSEKQFTERQKIEPMCGSQIICQMDFLWPNILPRVSKSEQLGSILACLKSEK